MHIGTKQPLLEQLIKWPTITTNDYDSDDDDDEEYAIFFQYNIQCCRFEPTFSSYTKTVDIDDSEDVSFHPNKMHA